jgi:hypothetical protein
VDHEEPRWDLIRHLQDQIAAGTYVTTGKLRVVCRRLLEELDQPSEPENAPRGLGLGRDDA